MITGNPLEGKSSTPESTFYQEPIIEIISPEEAVNFLRHTSIHGDKFRGRALSVSDIEKENLQPKFKISLSQNQILFSSPYTLTQGRIAVVGYALPMYSGMSKEAMVTRSFYLSNSGGLWRYMPKYAVKDGKIFFYGKGHAEPSITLPFALQKALAQISSSESPVVISDPEMIFAGSARNYANIIEAGTYDREVHQEFTHLGGNFYRNLDDGDRISPEDIKFTEQGDAPDFRKVIDSWEQNSKLYGGNIKVEIFPSKNGKYVYMFCIDKRGRVWIGGIEMYSSITSVGLRQTWVSGGDLTTPAFEYEDDSQGYGNTELVSGNYIDMFPDYLSRIPIIQEYLAVRK